MRIDIFIALVALVGSSAAYDTPHCDGRQVIVHLFEWKWTDIAAECERFLGPYEFCGVQVSPPNEHTLIGESGYPWWQRYQPVSYLLGSRSGTEDEFKDMVNRCNAVGVRIIVDAVVNHMAGLGRTGYGSAGSSFDSSALSFPGVPFGSNDFTPRDLCPSSDGNINDYSNVNEVRNCYLVGLTDLYGGSDYVRQKVAEFFNKLIAIGVMGFRVDAAKHMWPGDLEAILALTTDLNTASGFPAGSRAFFYHEVIDQGGEPITVDQYYSVGMVTEFRYCSKIAQGIESFYNLNNMYDPDWGMATPDKALIFTDNHDNQRGHGGAGTVLTHQSGNLYKMGVAFTLAYKYGFTRIMSSYYFDNTDQGPPGSNGGTDDVIINADGSCGGGWVCEHRWTPISQMVKFRNAVAGTENANWYQEGDTIAFSRGDKGFFAMNKYGSLDITLQTGLPAGTYCELISLCAQSITVNADGTAQILINNQEDTMIAFCQGCDGNDVVVPTVPSGPTDPPITSGTEKTVVFIHKQTTDGQDMFLRGGIDSEQRPGCTDDVTTDACAIDFTMTSLGTDTHYDKYNAWSAGDTKLDWFGAESGQGSYMGEEASGTPMAWTTNVAGSDGYQELNKYGEHYWMAEFEMDCSQTESGWFEVKSYLTNSGSGWETDVTQSTSCSGSSGGSRPYTTGNHFAKCGFVNVFEFSGSSCTIDAMSS